MGDITFIKGEGGLGRVAPGEDHISGLLVYGTPPAGYGNIQQFFSLKQAEDKGIVANGDTEVWYYLISEFFRLQANSPLWVAIYPRPSGSPVVYDFAEVAKLQREVEGKIRQMAVFIEEAFDTTQLSALQTQANTMFGEHMPLSLLFGADISGITDLSTLPDLRAQTSHYVSVLIGQDGENLGNDLATAKGYSIPCLGACLATLSKTKVSQNIGWVKRFNVVTEQELDVPALANGFLLKGLTSAELDLIANKGYVFLRKHTGIAGTYFNDSYTATSSTSDYSTIENNRTIDKGVRGVREALLPELNGELFTDASGQLSNSTIETYKGLANNALEAMEIAGELSGFSVDIDPSQNAIEKLEITLKLRPVGVARDIEIKLGFSLTT